MSDLTVACVWVHGHVPYPPVYVRRLRAMVAAHLATAHRFVCLTDQPWALPDVETIPVPCPAPLYGWWSKIQLFKPDRFVGRVLYLDLDTLVVRDVAPIVEARSRFALVPTAGDFQPTDGRRVIKRFNSSVMVWTAGVNEDLYTQWAPTNAALLHGDQDYIAQQWPAADLLPLEWFPRLSAIAAGPVPAEARVVLAKKPKPLEAAQRWPWVRDVWGAA